MKKVNKGLKENGEEEVKKKK